MFRIAAAQEGQEDIILELIRQLAVYEKLEQDVVATEEDIRRALFEQRSAECVIAFEDEKPVGFALYFFNFSTFLGKHGLYLEDLFVEPAFRGKGYGKALLLHLKQIAIDRNCGRMEWSVLDWNTPAQHFYRSLGAQPMEEWTVWRIAF